MYPSTSSATYLHSTAVLRGRVSVEPRISPTHTPHTVCRANASQLDMLHTGRVLGKTPVSGTARSHSSSGVFLSPTGQGSIISWVHVHACHDIVRSVMTLHVSAR